MFVLQRIEQKQRRTCADPAVGAHHDAAVVLHRHNGGACVRRLARGRGFAHGCGGEALLTQASTHRQRFKHQANEISTQRQLFEHEAMRSASVLRTLGEPDESPKSL